MMRKIGAFYRLSISGSSLAFVLPQLVETMTLSTIDQTVLAAQKAGNGASPHRRRASARAVLARTPISWSWAH
jgi:hypothetical protein